LSDFDLLRDPSFEEGILKIGVSAFAMCHRLKNAAFPALLIVIEARAFQGCGTSAVKRFQIALSMTLWFQQE
jgi:hypothetical protein